MNKLTIIGNLTADPELRTTPSGVSVCSFTVAVSSRYREQDGSPKRVDYIRVAAWRWLGENCSRYLAKGKKVCVVGEVTARAYEAKDGSMRASLELNADEVEFLSPRGSDGGSNSRERTYDAYGYPTDGGEPEFADPPAGWQEITDGDLPF
ncbi:MAG: single-stranded DNA-binding protein [Clostridia bacterium]|nr:single-stranded DNA-binding protein [Clostridia bacterium]